MGEDDLFSSLDFVEFKVRVERLDDFFNISGLLLLGWLELLELEGRGIWLLKEEWEVCGGIASDDE